MKSLRPILLALVVLGAARPAYGIPAFARKYGLKCTACHEAWPLLNVVGRAFRDNGYRFNNGKDDASSTDPSYWPIFAWVQENYQYQYNKSDTKTLANNGGVSSGTVILGAMGSLGEHISFRVVPIYEQGSVGFDAAWLRVNRIFNSDALNLRIGGALDFDLPIATAGERDITQSFPGGVHSLSYLYPSERKNLDLIGAPPGVELSGHDLGSANRYSVMVFNNTGVGNHTLFNTPSIYAHVSHLFQVPDGPVRDVEAGIFGSYATISAGPDSAALKPQDRYGGALDFWLFSDALPLHLEAIAFQGRDDKAIIPGATRDALYDGGEVQLDYVPALPFEVFARYNLVRNVTQPIPMRRGSYGDQNVYLIGFQHTVEFSSRFEWGWQVHYALEQDRNLAPDGTTLWQHLIWAGLLLAF